MVTFHVPAGTLHCTGAVRSVVVFPFCERASGKLLHRYIVSIIPPIGQMLDPSLSWPPIVVFVQSDANVGIKASSSFRQ